MADFSATIRTLQEQRQELLDQAAAIDRAIAALSAVGKGHRVPAPPAAAPRQVTPAAAARKKRTFVLSDEHKRKLVEGRRRAREARHAEPAPEPPQAGWSGPGAPRLVKKEPALAGVGPTEG